MKYEKIKDFIYNLSGVIFLILTYLSLIIFKIFSGLLVADIIGLGAKKGLIFLIVWYIIYGLGIMDGITSLLAFICIVLYSLKFPWMVLLFYPYVFGLYTLYMIAKIAREANKSEEL